MNYTGNSSIGFDADDRAPTLILRCGFCPAEIMYYGDGEETTIDDTFVLPEYSQAVCTCGAFFGEGDTLEVIDEAAHERALTEQTIDKYGESAF